MVNTNCTRVFLYDTDQIPQLIKYEKSNMEIYLSSRKKGSPTKILIHKKQKNNKETGY